MNKNDGNSDNDRETNGTYYRIYAYNSRKR